MPAQHREEFRRLLICSGNPGVERVQRLVGLDMLTPRRPYTAGWSFAFVCDEWNWGQQLFGRRSPQWAVHPKNYVYNVYTLDMGWGLSNNYFVPHI